MMKKLWMDEGGATISAELALVGTILVIGVVVGLSAVQDAVNTELADLGQAIGNLDQSYSTGGVSGHHAATSSSAYADAPDQCDAGTTSRCVVLCTGDRAGGTELTGPGS